MAKRQSLTEITRLKAEMIETPQEEGGELDLTTEVEVKLGGRFLVINGINKQHQEITDLKMRVPTRVLEYIDAHSDVRNDRTSILFHLLELGCDKAKETLKNKDLEINYSRGIKR